MSCDVAAAAFLFLASTGPSAPPAQPVPATVPHSVADEPLFVDIVGRAARLRDQVERYRTPKMKTSPKAMPLIGFNRFESQINDLAALDEKGHEHLVKSGEDGDLKCILHGISQDLSVKLKAVAQASTGASEDLALRDMFYLLRDNVEVITTPPSTPPA